MKSYTLLDILDNTVEYLKEEKLLTIELSGIKIPRIQRDYAQGREDEENVRNRFLKAIFEHLDSKREVMDLDFIYGSLKELNDKTFFIPLDGQQRLTTLFLLNWYVANVELQNLEHNEEQNKKYIYLNKLSNFSYETRPAAKNFCKNFVTFSFVNDPITEIKNQTWFLEYYNHDPTIASMLNMLSAIHCLYLEYDKKFFTRLSTLRFYIMPLDGFNLSDELYIKMNARGKQLSDFENFKADLINWMKFEKNIHSFEFNTLVEYHNQNIPFFLRIASKFDNEWSDIFWSTRNQIDYDKGYFAFITRFAVTYYSNVNSKTNAQIEKSELFTSFTTLKDSKLDYRYVGFELFENLLNYEFIISLEKVLDTLANNKEIINNCTSPLWDSESKWKLYSLDIIPRQYVLFYGIVQYLENNEFNEIKFKEWVRVLWNIVIDPKIRTFGAMIAIIKTLITPLIEFSNDINENLLSDRLSKKLKNLIIDENYEQSILFQEIQKAKKIEEDVGYNVIIYKLESHPMFKGHISFIANATSISDAQNLQKAAETICVNKQGELGKPANYNWLRAVLILNNNLEPYLKNDNILTLLDGSFEQWNSLINNELRSGFYNLLLQVIALNCNPVDHIIDSFTFDYSKLWLWNLTKQTITEGGNQYSLIDYSESKNVKLYKSKIYLFNKIIWTESNILLSSLRSQLISALLLGKKYSFSSDWANIDNKFFRGWNPEIYFFYKNVKVSLIFKSKEVWIGIKKLDIELLNEIDTNWLNKDDEENDIYRKHVIDFSDLISLDEVAEKAKIIDSYITEIYN